MKRPTAVRVIAVAAAIALWVLALAAADYDGETLVHDAGFAATTAVLSAAALAAQVRRPGKAVAALQQIGLCAVAYALAAVVADGRYVALAVGLAAVLALLLVVHPVGGVAVAIPDEVSPLLTAVALLAAVPLVLYALDAGDGALAAMGFGVALVALLAAARTSGWRTPVWSAAAAAALWGAACVVRPDAAGSEGRVWGGLAVAWGVAFVLCAYAVQRRSAPTE